MARRQSEVLRETQTAKAQFGMSCDELKTLNELRGVEAIARVGELGGVEQLCARLRTDTMAGVSGEPADLRSRVLAFGANVIPPKPPKSFFALVWDALQDATLVILIVAAIVSIATSFYKPNDDDSASVSTLIII
jgi:Ca2+ transporting ATPase